MDNCHGISGLSEKDRVRYNNDPAFAKIDVSKLRRKDSNVKPTQIGFRESLDELKVILSKAQVIIQKIESIIKILDS